MHPHFRLWGGSSKSKGFTHYTRQKVHHEYFSTRLDPEVNYNDTSNYNPLFFAVHDGELALIHSLLNDFSTDEKISGRQIIHIAAARGHEQIICLLREKGVEIRVGDTDGNTPLHLAVREGHIGAVDLLLTDFTINKQNWNGETPLHIATQENNIPIVKILLKNGAKVDLPDVDGKTPFHISTGKVYPYMKTVMILLAHGASVHTLCKRGFTPLHYVTNSGNVKITEVLMDRGASLYVQNENKMDPLCLAIQKNQTEMVKYIWRRTTDAPYTHIGNMTPLHFAAQAGNEEIVKMLIAEGDPDMINAIGEGLKTPLHFSAAKGHINVVKYLIESGASIDVETEDLNTPLHFSAAAGHLEIVSELLNRGANIDSINKERFTPLYMAVKAGHKEVVSLLVNKGATTDCRRIVYSISDDDFIPAYHIAAKSGNLEILKIFLDSGIEVDFRSKDEKTALHFSAAFGHTKLVEELVKRGADIHSYTKSFETPLHLAAASGKSETVKYLLDLGADVDVRTDQGFSPLNYALDRERHDRLKKYQNTNRSSASSLRRISSRKQVVISPFSFVQILKITEMLLIKDACVVSKTHDNISPLDYALKIKVTKEIQQECAPNSLEEFSAPKKRRKSGQGEFRPEIVRCLLNYGAPVNYSLLYEAINSKCPAMVDTLMEYDIRKCLNYEGALELACRQNDHIILAMAEQISNADYIAEILLRRQYNSVGLRWYSGVNYGKNFTKLLIAIWVKMRSLSKVNNFVQSKEVETFVVKEKLLTWYTQCKLEIVNMREMKVHQQYNLTFYEVLTGPVSKLANYVRNKELLKILNFGVSKKFEAYSVMLERNIERGKERRALIDSAAACLLSVVLKNYKIQLPNLVVDKIFKHLSVIDLRKLSATITEKSDSQKRSCAHHFRHGKKKKY